MESKQTFFQNDYNTIYSVHLLWSIGQPLVFGTLQEVVKYALKPNNGIDYFCEITPLHKVKKVSKKDLKNMLESQGLKNLSDELFKKY